MCVCAPACQCACVPVCLCACVPLSLSRSLSLSLSLSLSHSLSLSLTHSLGLLSALSLGSLSLSALPLSRSLSCCPHSLALSLTRSAIKGKHHLLIDNTEETQKQLFTDLNFIHELQLLDLVPIAINRFVSKWRALRENKMMDYFVSEWASKKWSRAYGKPGEPSDNNTLESLNRVLKMDVNFAKTTSLGLCLGHALLVVHRLSRDVKPLELSPVVSKKTWVAAQKLVDQQVFKLGYKFGDKFVVPSEKLLASLPGSTTAEKKQNISVWVKEFTLLARC